MLQCVRHEAEMRRSHEGLPQRTHLQRLVERGHTAMRRVLEGPLMPKGKSHLWATWDAIQYLWTWFLELDRTRTYHAMSGRPEPITYQMVDAWARLTGREVLPHEVDALMRMDIAYLNAVAAAEGTASQAGAQ